MDDMHTTITTIGEVNNGLDMYGRRLFNQSHIYSRVDCSDTEPEPMQVMEQRSESPDNPGPSSMDNPPPSYSKATGVLVTKEQVARMALCLMTDDKFISKRNKLQTTFPSEDVDDDLFNFSDSSDGESNF